MLQAGDRFPAFSGQTHDGQHVNLADFTGRKNVVLFFYPEDMTSGCTREAQGFSQHLADFAALDTVVYGISVQSLQSHQEFASSCDLTVALLSDEGGALSRQLGILNDKGKAQRTTFVIDKSGAVSRVFEGVVVDGHVDLVLEAVRAL